MEWMLMPLRRYADFDGRSRRMEYWMFYLFTLGLGMAIAVIGVALAMVLYTMNLSETAMGIILVPIALIVFVVSMGLVVPSIAVAVRRLHDQDKSGWMLLLGLIPFVGGIIFIVLMCLEGTHSPNRFGPDPIQGRGASNTFG